MIARSKEVIKMIKLALTRREYNMKKMLHYVKRNGGAVVVGEILLVLRECVKLNMVVF